MAFFNNSQNFKRKHRTKWWYRRKHWRFIYTNWRKYKKCPWNKNQQKNHNGL